MSISTVSFRTMSSTSSSSAFVQQDSGAARVAQNVFAQTQPCNSQSAVAFSPEATAELLTVSPPPAALAELQAVASQSANPVEQESPKDLQELLDKKRDLVNAKDEWGKTLLLCTTGLGYPELCNFLLMKAVEWGCLEAYQLLLESLLNVKNVNGQNVLHLAAKRGDLQILTLVLTKGKDLLESVDDEGRTPLLLAAYWDRLEVCEALLAAGAEVGATDFKDRNVFHLAAAEGNFKIVNYFANLLSNNKLPNLKCPKDLLESEDDEGRTPLLLATYWNRPKVCDALLKAGADVGATDFEGRNVFHLAAAERNSETVNYFANLPLDRKLLDSLLNSKCKEGKTPLMYAAYKGSVESCKILVGARAEVYEKGAHSLNAIHWAAGGGYLETVEFFATLSDQELLNSKGEDGVTPLMCAAYNEHLGACKILVHKGAGVHVMDVNGRGAVHWAAIRGHSEIVEYFANLPNDRCFPSLRETMDKDGRTPLLLGAYHGHLGVCDALLKAGANVHAMDGNRRMAIHWAAIRGYSKIVEFFAKPPDRRFPSSKEKRDKDGCTPLLWGAYQGHLGVCEVLLKAEAEVSVKSLNGQNVLHAAIHAAISGGNLEIVRQIVKIKYPLQLMKDNASNTPLMRAASLGDLEVCKLLVGLIDMAYLGAVDSNGLNALHIASKAGKLPIVQLLITKDSRLCYSKSNQGHTPLMFAAYYGHLDICDFLVNFANVNTNVVRFDGRNAFHIASQAGKLAVVKLLKNKNESLCKSQDQEGHTPLMLAAYYGHLDICDYLVNVAKVDTNVARFDGINALHLASSGGKIAVVQFLAEANKNLLSLKDKKGNTPLMVAGVFGQLEICKELLKEGADINAMSDPFFGWDTLSLAKAYGHKAVVEYLTEYLRLRPARSGVPPLSSPRTSVASSSSTIITVSAKPATSVPRVSLLKAVAFPSPAMDELSAVLSLMEDVPQGGLSLQSAVAHNTLVITKMAKVLMDHDKRLAALETTIVKTAEKHMDLFKNLIEMEDLARQTKAERIEIDKNEETEAYYRCFSRRLTAVWIACQAIHSTLLAPDGTTVKSLAAGGIKTVGQGIAAIGKGINAIGKHIPLISAATAALSFVLSFWNEREQLQAAGQVTRFWHDLPTAFKCFEELARKLTIAQKPAILALGKQSMTRSDKGRDLKSGLFGEDIRGPIEHKAVKDLQKILDLIISKGLKSEPKPTMKDFRDVVIGPTAKLIASPSAQGTVVATAPVRVVNPVFAPTLSSSPGV